LGVDTFRPVVEVRKDTPAALAGFQTGDTLTAINGEAVTSWDDLHMLLIEDYLTSPRLEISVTTPEGNNVQRVLDLGDKPMFKDETDFLNKAGLGLWMRGIGIAGVLEGSAAAQAGLQAGDKVLSVGGTAPQSVQDFIQIIQQHAEQTIALQIRRGDNDVSINVTPQSKDLDGKTVGSLGANVGAYMTDAVRAELAFTQRYGVFDALWLGMVKTKQMSVVTLKLMGRMLTGEVALKNISGPVTIAQFAGTTASIGLGAFLGFLAIVSISLGVLNLLPIPMLDGGHLMYYLVEWVKGSPVSAEVEAVGLRIGMALIGCLMVLALYNDFMRLMN
jgi:regulator of sigma E protease